MFNPRLSVAGFVRLIVFQARQSCEVLVILFWGLLSLFQIDETRQPPSGAPNHRAPRLGARVFSISVLNSFGVVLFAATK